jgi:hypothetical protein
VLNRFAGHYINTQYTLNENSARSVGSNPTDTQHSVGNTANYGPTSAQQGWPNANIYLSGRRAADTTYTTDRTALAGGSMLGASGSTYWMASRVTQQVNVGAVQGVQFGGRVEYGNLLGDGFLLVFFSDGSHASFNFSSGVRPVITLRPDLQVVDSGLRTTDGKIIWDLI